MVKPCNPNNFTLLPCPFAPRHEYGRDGHCQEKGGKKILIKSILAVFWVVTGELSCESMLATLIHWGLSLLYPQVTFAPSQLIC